MTDDTPALRSLTWKRFLRAPDTQLLHDLYNPALSRAVHYDRCCAYFSSQVLAVAARGFGGLIEMILTSPAIIPRPAVRLLVNEQLDPDDYHALLSTGNDQPLIDRLLERFGTPKDALEHSRLEMLSWLVASDWLEVKVGLMRRMRGISHAKFGIITDRHGDRLAFMGSDNETGAALTENYEELEIRPSWQDEEFVAYYHRRFDLLWHDQDPHVTVVSLPDAVRLKLLSYTPVTPPQREMHQDNAPMKRAMRWHFLAAAPFLPNGESAVDSTALVAMWPHQQHVVADTARAFPAGRLLCDEVGMGKTIEAILVLRRLLAGRGVQRALLLVPAGLLVQWQDELREKGGLLVPRWESGYLYEPDGSKQAVEPAAALSTIPLLLVSREWARLDKNRALVLSAPPWDLVLLDEAHAARRTSAEEREFNTANLLLHLLRDVQLRCRTRGLLLLSATPMQTHPWEPWDLLAVLGVGGSWMVAFDDIRQYYQGIHDLRHDLLDPSHAAMIERLVTHDPTFPAVPESLAPERGASLRDTLLFAMHDQQQAYADWLLQGSPLKRWMHRNTRETLRAYHDRGFLALPPPRRDVQDLVYDYTAQAERDCYQSIEQYINARYEQLEHEKTGKGFVMTIYRRRAASSPLALRRSLTHRLQLLAPIVRGQWAATTLATDEAISLQMELNETDSDEIDPGLPRTPETAAAEQQQIEALLARLDQTGSHDSKLDLFLVHLRMLLADGRSLLVFTEYTDTLEYLRDHLRPWYGATLGCYSGNGGQCWNGQEWQSVSKADITSRLHTGGLTILLCTDAASEGLNLQAASALINYDLPWNPSKVEQRIGRIDRIGQQHPVLPVRNIFLAASVDMLVYQALRQRCGLFEHFVGHMQPVLAAARDVLRHPPQRAHLVPLLRDLEQTATHLNTDTTIVPAFAADEVDDDRLTRPTPTPVPPVTRDHIRDALDDLATCGDQVQCHTDAPDTWCIRGVADSPITVTMSRELVERDPSVVPVTASSPLFHQLAQQMPLQSVAPLVLATDDVAPYCCIEARWVQPDGIITITTATHLEALLAAWDGTLPSPAMVLQAHQEARQAAVQRVAQMRQHADRIVRFGLQQQVEAAQQRLKREVARTLRCLGSGDLTTLLREQVRGDPNSNGRYQRVLQQLEGELQWSDAERLDADTYVAQITPRQRQSRINLGSEIEAALNDPRWRARNALNQ